MAGQWLNGPGQVLTDVGKNSNLQTKKKTLANTCSRVHHGLGIFHFHTVFTHANYLDSPEQVLCHVPSKVADSVAPAL